MRSQGTKDAPPPGGKHPSDDCPSGMKKRKHSPFRNSEESLDFTDGPCGYAENGSGVIQIGKRLSSHAASRTVFLNAL
ncbi:hypothetical protein MJT46_019114 [Ovis ammon polii x Ovis aries]|nr:hypothetical protein MJT46_019114 [Ovis ammon polii x Ovis aries]